MLTTVKQYIKDLSDISFNEFFVQYIMKVQDTNIEQSTKHLYNTGTTDLKSINKVIDTTLRSLLHT